MDNLLDELDDMDSEMNILHSKDYSFDSKRMHRSTSLMISNDNIYL